jgi:hypothetical protein
LRKHQRDGHASNDRPAWHLSLSAAGRRTFRRASRALNSPTLNEKLVRSYAEEAARLRDLAVNVTTIRLKTRLLEEADNQHRLAQAARRGIVQPHPIALMDR